MKRLLLSLSFLIYCLSYGHAQSVTENINTIKRDRKYRVGIRLLEKYCKKNALYNVIPKDNTADAYQIQFNALICNLNCTLFVKCYIVKNKYISEYCLPLKTVWMPFNDGNNDVHML